MHLISVVLPMVVFLLVDDIRRGRFRLFLRRKDTLLGMKDPNSAGARRVMKSSGRLTRTVALVKSKYKTRIVSAY